MYPYTSPYPQTYPPTATYVGPRSAPGSTVFALVCSIVVFALALLASPLTVLFSLGAALSSTDPGVVGSSAELVGVMIVAFLPLGAPAILGAALAMHPRIRMPREFYPASGVRGAATVFLVLHLLCLLVAVVLGVLPQILVL